MKIISDHIAMRREEAKASMSDSSHRRMNIRVEESVTVLNKVRRSKPHPAIEQLTNHQRQLDQDGIMVGVSRQALEEVLEWLKD